MSVIRGIERLALHVIVQAVADLCDNQTRTRLDHETERAEAQRSAWRFLTGAGPDNEWGIEWWCDHIGLDPAYIARVARKIKDDTDLATEIRHRISYIGSDGSQGSIFAAFGVDEDLEGEETSESREVEEAERRAAEDEWRSLTSNSSFKRENAERIG